MSSHDYTQELPERRSAPLPRADHPPATSGTLWGNYKDYHGTARHFPGSLPSSHAQDPRLTLIAGLVPGLFTAKRCLDIGCNAGAVAVQLALNFDAASVTGVDIDPELVRKAEETFGLRASRVRPATTDSDRAVDYYPISAILKHGYRPRVSMEKASLTVCPPTVNLVPESPRVSFVSADWVSSQNPATSGPYDVILALSVIKWIHLEHLDEGLVSFFRKCALSLVDGGYLILESQPWTSYEKAVRPGKAPHFKENLKRLKYRPETCFDKLLQEQGLILCETSDALPRRISVYCKQSGRREHVRGEGDLGNQTITAE